MDTLTHTAEAMKTLLIVDDDKPFLQRLARAMEARGFAVDTADTVADGLTKVDSNAPTYAVVDMRLGDGNGSTWWNSCATTAGPTPAPSSLTGYGNIATA